MQGTQLLMNYAEGIDEYSTLTTDAGKRNFIFMEYFFCSYCLYLNKLY